MSVLIDVTRRIHDDAPNWPGDTPVHYELVSSMTAGSSVNVGSVSMSTHTGTHVDAPWHYDETGSKLHEVALETWIGPCLVVDARGAPRLEAALLRDVNLEGASKVLFFTGQPNVWLEFPRTWAVVDPDLPPFLAEHGITLIGTDAPSADTLTSKNLPGHKALARAGVCLLESLALDGVPPGRYRLVCLPLNLEEADGAPARVILER
jgi:arylformamidase